MEEVLEDFEDLKPDVSRDSLGKFGGLRQAIEPKSGAHNIIPLSVQASAGIVFLSAWYCEPWPL